MYQIWKWTYFMYCFFGFSEYHPISLISKWIFQLSKKLQNTHRTFIFNYRGKICEKLNLNQKKYKKNERSLFMILATSWSCIGSRFQSDDPDRIRSFPNRRFGSIDPDRPNTGQEVKNDETKIVNTSAKNRLEATNNFFVLFRFHIKIN